MTATPLTRLERHRSATHDPARDLAWWLWDLAGDVGGPLVLDRLAAVRKVDDIGRLLIRGRVLRATTPDSLDKTADMVRQRWGRRISRQGLHNRELDLRRDLEPVFLAVEKLAVTTHLEGRLAVATHTDDLDPWERAILEATTEVDAPWPDASDVATAVATALGRRHAVDEGWWFACAPGTRADRGMTHVVETLRRAITDQPKAPSSLRHHLELAGITQVSGQRLAERLVSDRLAIETGQAIVLFPTTSTLTMADRLLYLRQVLDTTLDEASKVLIDHCDTNPRSLANTIRDLKRRDDIVPSAKAVD